MTIDLPPTSLETFTSHIHSFELIFSFSHIYRFFLSHLSLFSLTSITFLSLMQWKSIRLCQPKCNPSIFQCLLLVQESWTPKSRAFIPSNNKKTWILAIILKYLQYYWNICKFGLIQFTSSSQLLLVNKSIWNHHNFSLWIKIKINGIKNIQN